MNIINTLSWVDIISFILALIAIIISLWTYIDNNKIEKKKRTIEAYIKLQEYLYCLYEYKDSEIRHFVNDTSSKEYKMLSSCVAEIELFAVAVKEGLYDFNLVYKMAHGYLDITIRKRVNAILEIKESYTKEEYYSEIKWLFNKMDEQSEGQK